MSGLIYSSTDNEARIRDLQAGRSYQVVIQYILSDLYKHVTTILASAFLALTGRSPLSGFWDSMGLVFSHNCWKGWKKIRDKLVELRAKNPPRGIPGYPNRSGRDSRPARDRSRDRSDFYFYFCFIEMIVAGVTVPEETGVDLLIGEGIGGSEADHQVIRGGVEIDTMIGGIGIAAMTEGVEYHHLLVPNNEQETTQASY